MFQFYYQSKMCSKNILCLVNLSTAPRDNPFIYTGRNLFHINPHKVLVGIWNFDYNSNHYYDNYLNFKPLAKILSII